MLMLKCGRYGISLGRTFWIQTRAPTKFWHYLCFWFFKEARPNDIDKKQEFPLGTLMEYEGRRYYYKAGKDIVVSEVDKTVE